MFGCGIKIEEKKAREKKMKRRENENKKDFWIPHMLLDTLRKIGIEETEKWNRRERKMTNVINDWCNKKRNIKREWR